MHRMLVGLAAAAGLWISAALADQQDWSDCSGQDAARAIAPCSRIIADQSASAQDRADAYLYRAGAELAQGDLDRAVADYSEAIRLSPTNLVAYASRAIAYARKGDRDRAVADFRSAQRIDADKLAGIAAGNPEVAQIAQFAAATPSAPSANVQAATILPVRPHAGPHVIGEARDWAECAGADAARAIEACSRIIALAENPSGPHSNESGADFFDSLSYRAGAYFAQHDFRHAIADYGRAITSGPTIVTPRLDLAMALWLDGKRDRAITAYTIAQRIDGGAVAAQAAGNALIAAIAEQARVSPPREHDVRGFAELYRSGPRPLLGLQYQPLTEDMAEKLNLKGRHGVLVQSVAEEGPAKRAGIEPGDLIIRFGGEDILEYEDMPLSRFVVSSPVGKPIEVVIVRNGVEQRRMVTLVLAPPAPPAPPPPRASGMSPQCENEGHAFTWEVQLDACTALIKSGNATGRDLARIYHNRARAHLEAHGYDDAIHDLDEVIRLAPDWAEAYFARGLSRSELLEVHGHDKAYHRLAVADFDEAIRLDPHKAKYFSGRGVEYSRMADYAHSIPDFDRALKIEPNSASFLYLRGQDRRDNGDKKGAEADIARAKKINPRVGTPGGW
jgi:tetratricopeptide (TPR) repeat protein